MFKVYNMFSSLQSLSRVRLCDPMNHSTPSLPVHHQLPEFTQIHVHRVSDAIQPSHPLSSPSPPALSLPASKSFPMSQLFAWGGQSTGVSALASFFPKKSQGWSPSEWLDLLAVQGTLKSLLQHHSSKALVQCSAKIHIICDLTSSLSPNSTILGHITLQQRLVNMMNVERLNVKLKTVDKQVHLQWSRWWLDTSLRSVMVFLREDGLNTEICLEMSLGL